MNKKLPILILKTALSAAILAYLFHTAWSTEQFHDLSTEDLNWGWMGMAILLCVTAHVVSYLRWRVMVRALDIPFNIYDAVRIGFIGSFFNLFAFGVVGGDSLRAFYVTRQVKHRVPEVIASVLADRMIGLLTMFSFASAAFFLTDISHFGDTANPQKTQAMITACRFIVTATLLGYSSLVALLFIPRLTQTRGFNRLLTIPKLGPMIGRLAQVLNVYQQKKRALGFCFLLSAVIVGCFTTSIFSIALAINNSHPTLAQHFIITPISMTANAIPLPGGIGGMELALDFLYQAFASNDGNQRAIVIAFTFRFVLLITSAIGAAAWFLQRKQDAPHL